ncbi:hypothetical protein CIT292_11203 [Citrobacter youngae ATCC 29220]|uniref:Uncharacterized protein n=1 Tax=Citrobacter youngae ATCC 29220 TaxID=500640 RepID=D4BKX3_9ENTR|nr:hypothetical protein CIT292_11203 [Citrobacter youngae ATCC 29220]
MVGIMCRFLKGCSEPKAEYTAASAPDKKPTLKTTLVVIKARGIGLIVKA